VKTKPTKAARAQGGGAAVAGRNNPRGKQMKMTQKLALEGILRLTNCGQRNVLEQLIERDLRRAKPWFVNELINGFAELQRKHPSIVRQPLALVSGQTPNDPDPPNLHIVKDTESEEAHP
jgi:hypothetical protein